MHSKHDHLQELKGWLKYLSLPRHSELNPKFLERLFRQVEYSY